MGSGASSKYKKGSEPEEPPEDPVKAFGRHQSAEEEIDLSKEAKVQSLVEAGFTEDESREVLDNVDLKPYVSADQADEELAAPRPTGTERSRPSQISTPSGFGYEQQPSHRMATPPRSNTSRGATSTSGHSDDMGSSEYYEEDPNALQTLKAAKLYIHKDPFRFLTAEWLETGIKPLEEDLAEPEVTESEVFSDAVGFEDDEFPEPPPEEPEEVIESEFDRAEREAREEEEAEKKAADDAELLRKRTVLKQCSGWQEWLHGRQLSSEFRARGPVPAALPPAPVEERPSPLEEGRPPRRVRGAQWLLGPINVRERERKVCWLNDFVTEVRLLVESLHFQLPVVFAKAARRVIRKKAENVELFWHHMEVVDLDGVRQLWSPAFVNFLVEYWNKSGMGDRVCRTQEQVRQDAAKEGKYDPNDLFPLDLSARDEARRQRLGPVIIPNKPVPLEISKRKPPLPEMPKRLPWRVISHKDVLETELDRCLAGTEAWEAYLGTSSGFQRAGSEIVTNQSWKRSQEHGSVDLTMTPPRTPQQKSRPGSRGSRPGSRGSRKRASVTFGRTS